MNDAPLFRVAFSGVITGEYDLDTTKSRFARLFRLNQAKVDKLFNGKEYVLKDKVSEEVAMNFAIRIAETGCECYIETLPDIEIVAGSHKGQDRRKGDRRITFRRPARPGDITPDRRVLAGRRKDDQPRQTDPQQIAS